MSASVCCHQVIGSARVFSHGSFSLGLLKIKSLFGIILRLEVEVDIKNDIKPISYIKTHAADMLKRVNETHNPMIITQNGEAKAVLLDTESYQQMTKSIGILKLLAIGEKEIDKNELVDNETVFDQLKEKLPKDE